MELVALRPDDNEAVEKVNGNTVRAIKVGTAGREKNHGEASINLQINVNRSKSTKTSRNIQPSGQNKQRMYLPYILAPGERKAPHKRAACQAAS
mgnify:CR=1 FL=1